MNTGLMDLPQTVRFKKAQLDETRLAINAGALDDLERAQRIDITFTSNALEGNTLTAGETALVLETGMTVSGKPLKDHLEATDHANALDWIFEMTKLHADSPIKELDIRALHSLVVEQSNKFIGGQYADRARFVNTSAGVHDFPSPIAIPGMMGEFGSWLRGMKDTPETAFEAHRRLVAIHPFNDGNGRTARLLMNLVLLRAGYPAIAVRPEERPAYLAALEADQSGKGPAAFDQLMFERLDKTLDIYLGAAAQARQHDKNRKL